ncbi:MAG: adenylate/guanylate cyclase domain-containing protein, partial [Desulfocapsaceae bacterium]|nr:adenylate/guanylate cyclase domain-containing protein [Desulfocapsaceae bacterium]
MYINYYGPPATLTTYSFDDMLSARTSMLSVNNRINDAVVFVGAARASWSEQKDGFFTVFTQSDGLDLSGVEVAATIFSNLMDNRPLRPLHPLPSVLILSTIATLACLSSVLFSPLVALYTLAGIISCSLVVMCFFFSMNGIWSPVIIPLTVIPVGAYFSGSSYKYLQSRRERKHVQKALNLYLPANVVEEISRDPSFIKTADRRVHGICLLSDAVNYTSLSERLSPEELSSLMKRYFRVIFRQVNNNDGVVTNMIGDTMLAMWPSPQPHIGLNEKACRAALHILSAIEAFNRNNPDQALPTRLGLHSGYLLMGNIGAEGHYEYAPVGDIVNTASRIEGLNKLLGTWILASGETIEQINGVASRFMGTFLLSGKSNPVTIYQLLPEKMDITSADERVHCELFPEALDLFQKRKWAEAGMTLQQCLDLQPNDGPSRFYRELCRFYQRKPPAAEWQGIISVSK